MEKEKFVKKDHDHDHDCDRDHCDVDGYKDVKGETDSNHGDDEEDDKDGYDRDEYDKSVIDSVSNIENVRYKATVLVDNVLEESAHIVNKQQDRDHIDTYNVVAVDNNTRAEYNSESENYAITCDDVDGLDVIKSPTIESMSGKSFDDNLSFTDEHIATVVGPATTTTIQFVQQTHEQIQILPSQGDDEMFRSKFTTPQTSETKEFNK